MLLLMPPLVENTVKWQALLKSFFVVEITWAILSSFLMVVVFRIVSTAFHKLSNLLKQNDQKIPSIKIKNLEILSATQLLNSLLLALRILSIFLYGLLAFSNITIIFSLFPATHQLSQVCFKLFQQSLNFSWHAFTQYLPNIFSILIIVVIAFYFLKLLKMILSAIAEDKLHFKGFYKEWARPTLQISQFLTIILVLVMIFPLLPGFKSPAFQGVGLFLGALLSLGSTNIVNNIISGFLIVYMRTFQVGDRVLINNTTGYVIENSLLATKIKTLNNEEVSIPNSLLLANPITNYSSQARQEGLIIATGITIGYDVPWRQVHELLIQAAKSTEHVLLHPEPFVLQKSLDDYYVSYELKAFTRSPEKLPLIYSMLHQNIQDGFNASGVEILSPHYRAHRDGPSTVILPLDQTGSNPPQE